MSEVPLRITIVRPPKGVQFCLQGKTSADLVDKTVATESDISFDFSVRLAPREAKEPPRFLGEHTHGPPSGRFVYLCVGTLAGQADSCWTRRVKIPLAGLTWPLIEGVWKKPGARLEARYQGTGKDGGPACATVPLLGGWKQTA